MRAALSLTHAEAPNGCYMNEYFFHVHEYESLFTPFINLHGSKYLGRI